MTLRRPVVLLAGAMSELPTGDTVAGALSPPITGSGSVDFGATATAFVRTTIANAQVHTNAIVHLTPTCAATADHDPDDYAVEGLSLYAANIVNNVSFDVIATCNSETHGVFTFTYSFQPEGA